MAWPRFSVKRLLAIVAFAALFLGLVAWMQRRADRFRAEASRHLERWLVEAGADSNDESPLADYHLAMARKYERAARSPWVPVERDPPESE